MADGSTTTTFFDPGTTLLFYQPTAPTGWTRIDTHNNKALRVVSGNGPTGGGQGSSTGGGSGGGANNTFTSVFASRTLTGNVNPTTLTLAQIPSHTHSYTVVTSKVSPYDRGVAGASVYSSVGATSTGSAGGDGSHDHGFSGIMDFAVQYIDLILCSKN
jgi:hypothetical protein